MLAPLPQACWFPLPYQLKLLWVTTQYSRVWLLQIPIGVKGYIYLNQEPIILCRRHLTLQALIALLRWYLNYHRYTPDQLFIYIYIYMCVCRHLWEVAEDIQSNEFHDCEWQGNSRIWVMCNQTHSLTFHEAAMMLAEEARVSKLSLYTIHTSTTSM